MSALIKCYQFPRLQNQQNCTYHSLYYQRQYNLQSHAEQHKIMVNFAVLFIFLCFISFMPFFFLFVFSIIISTSVSDSVFHSVLSPFAELPRSYFMSSSKSILRFKSRGSLVCFSYTCFPLPFLQFSSHSQSLSEFYLYAGNCFLALYLQ